MRLSAGERLVAALGARGGDASVVRLLASVPWASATFSGARHEIEVLLPDTAILPLTAGIEEAEFDLRGHIVADLAVRTRDAMPDGRARLLIEALTVEAA